MNNVEVVEIEGIREGKTYEIVRVRDAYNRITPEAEEVMRGLSNV